MIKIFRQTRNALLKTNKITKYFIYAVGEIVLVVIGILIALSLNNWNEQNKNSKSEIVYYSRILEDFNLDKKLIEELSEKADNRIKLSKEILVELDSGTKTKNYLLNKFLIAIRSDAYVPRNVAFQDLISSGNLNLLNDVNLKNSLIQYYSELENIQSQLKQNRNEKIKESFELVNSSIEFGQTEFEYIHQLLGKEIIDILPQYDWTKEKKSEDYKNFQLMLIFNIAMSDREKQHLSAINNLMELPYGLLTNKLGIK